MRVGVEGSSMSDAGDAFEAILGLVVGGIIFVAFGSALAGTALGENSFVNFEFWGVIYILVAIVLAAALVGGMVLSLLSA